MKIDFDKELRKEAKKLEDLGFEVPNDLNIESKKIKNAFGTYTPCTSTVAVDSDFLDFASIKEIRALIAHETCHSISGLYGHDAIWFSAVSKLVENFSDDYDKAEIHLAKPYSKERKNAMVNSLNLKKLKLEIHQMDFMLLLIMVVILENYLKIDHTLKTNALMV